MSYDSVQRRVIVKPWNLPFLGRILKEQKKILMESNEAYIEYSSHPDRYIVKPVTARKNYSQRVDAGTILYLLEANIELKEVPKKTKGNPKLFHESEPRRAVPREFYIDNTLSASEHISYTPHLYTTERGQSHYMTESAMEELGEQIERTYRMSMDGIFSTSAPTATTTATAAPQQALTQEQMTNLIYRVRAT